MKNLFNGEYYIQKVKGIAKDKVPKGLIVGMGAADTEHPDFQVGDGCLVDQLSGQYGADTAGLGNLVDEAHIRKTMQSIYKYNYKRSMFRHESVQRIYALNDEAALIVCDYGRGKRPEIPFPYFSELFTGLEYVAATLMLRHGMVAQGTECVESIRRRYDGERRNPWNEAECGHHYARAMASWAALLAFGGFQYHAAEKAVAIVPVLKGQVRSFWSAGTGWGAFVWMPEPRPSRSREANFAMRSVKLSHAPPKARLRVGSRGIAHKVERGVFQFEEELKLTAGQVLKIAWLGVVI